jgi:hypothetical protein
MGLIVLALILQPFDKETVRLVGSRYLPGARKDELKRLAHEHKGRTRPLGAAAGRDRETRQRATATESGREPERSGGSSGVPAAAGLSEGLPPSGAKKKIIEMHKEICHQLGIPDGLNITPIQLCQVRVHFFFPSHSVSPCETDRCSARSVQTAREELGMLSANASVPLSQNIAEIMAHLNLPTHH